MKDFRPTFYLLTIIFIVISTGLLNHNLKYKVLAQEANANTQDDKARVAAKPATPTVRGEVETSPTLADKQIELEKVITKYFGKNARVFIAVQKFECSSSRSDYPKCTKWDNIEKSCGVAQINLDWHADKVKGDTLQEKCTNLYDIDYNIKIAKQIYDSSGFWAWTAYSSGAYLRNL